LLQRGQLQQKIRCRRRPRDEGRVTQAALEAVEKAAAERDAAESAAAEKLVRGTQMRVKLQSVRDSED